ncbi:exosortase A-associated hydrolase 2 [Plasticicumulans lactativorans]|uniref:Exosortase A-associated hydrolase 2 n=1 Tax=Plasticicumulans lactativorans TaxID=1133106 RepID=A0A4R2LA02_9GAMM|nr:hydrolase 2, exosortase A system-associated [Plasticicumulans lactativorans]TCO80996.1 exosortase A-associated hydrolase 2 [Plasticicumulans lactativorans]
MEPLFIDAGRKRLFALFLPPSADRPPRGGVLYVPPFAEEMNKSRAMAVSAARAFAAAGWGVLLPDLFGTGDSEGDFGDARWEGWRGDLTAAAAWLAQRCPGTPVVWGLRLGALLALDAAQRGALDARAFLLWQPTSSGEQALTQFLRLRLAATLRDGEPETPASLRARLAAGESIEVAGYALNPELATAIDACRAPAAPAMPTAWIEVVAESGRTLSPATRRTLDAWAAAGCSAQASAVVGEAFWGTQEIAAAPALIAPSLAFLQELPA